MLKSKQQAAIDIYPARWHCVTAQPRLWSFRALIWTQKTTHMLIQTPDITAISQQWCYRYKGILPSLHLNTTLSREYREVLAKSHDYSQNSIDFDYRSFHWKRHRLSYSAYYGEGSQAQCVQVLRPRDITPRPPVVKEYLDRHNHTNTNLSNDLVCASFETKPPSGIDASLYGRVAVISSDKYRAIICRMYAPTSSCKWCCYWYQFQCD